MPLSKDTIQTLDLLRQVANFVKLEFVGKDVLVDLMTVCAIAQEHLLIVGPPGTAKSGLIKRFAKRCARPSKPDHVAYFEYLLTRFTEPGDIFGVINVEKYQRGEGARRETKGMLPCAEIAFLDEVFKANSAILNALLPILNERIFYNGEAQATNGQDQTRVPLLCAVGATNSVPEPDDDELAPLFDRFLVRAYTDNVEDALFSEFVDKGWKLECEQIRHEYRDTVDPLLSADQLRDLFGDLKDVRIDRIYPSYHEVVRRIRLEGIALSDRRVIKLIKLVAASALLNGRDHADPEDFWVLRHVGGDKEQIPHLQAILDPFTQEHDGVASSRERRLDELDGSVKQLEGRRHAVSRLTGSAALDFLRQAADLRNEVTRHSSARGDDAGQRDGLLQKIDRLIDDFMRDLADNG